MSHPLFYGTTGPQDARIMIVGEAWGRDELSAKKPFVGASGMELDRMLGEAGISRSDCLCSNVVAGQPLNNQMWRFFHPRDEKKPDYWGLHPHDSTRQEISRLWQQIAACQPTLIIAVGNYALWALTESARITYKGSDERGAMEGGGRMVPTGVGDFRGSMLWTRPSHTMLWAQPKEFKIPVLPIIHPAAILREWSWRAITIHDLKTRIPMAFAKQWEAPLYKINIRPTVEQAEEYFASRMELANTRPVECSIDLETMVFDNNWRGVTCISFCTEMNNAITIPFIDKTPAGDIVPYWPSPQTEARAVRAMCNFMAHSNVGAFGQNFLYDESYIRDHWAVVPRVSFDTMLAHHLIWPGTPKALGYLSSIYCEHHRFWKDDNREWGNKASPDTHFLYNGEDAIRTFEIAGRQRALISQLGLDALWNDELEKQELAFEMMSRGVKIDLKARGRLVHELMAAGEQHQAALLTLMPQAWVDSLMGKAKPAKEGKFWFSSSKQVQFVFYDILGMPLQKERKTGNATVGAKALEVLRDKMPQFALLFDLLENMRSIANMSAVLRVRLSRDSRMRCSFNTGGTETFRWSSSESPLGEGTNLQNVTSGEE